MTNIVSQGVVITGYILLPISASTLLLVILNHSRRKCDQKMHFIRLFSIFALMIIISVSKIYIYTNQSGIKQFNCFQNHNNCFGFYTFLNSIYLQPLTTWIFVWEYF
jgi:hypothetical protein